jgi:hypothetical protein
MTMTAAECRGTTLGGHGRPLGLGSLSMEVNEVLRLCVRNDGTPSSTRSMP